MNVKKCISWSLIVAILCAIILSFTSCSKNKNYDIQKIKYYCSEKSDILDIIEKYNNYCLKNYDESYQIEIVKFDSEDDMNTKMSTEIMAGGGPDIFSLDQALPFEKLIDNGTFADVDELLEQYDYDIDFSDYNETIINCGINNKKRYFIPIFYCPNVLITTQEILNKYDLEDINFSFEALETQLSKYNESYSLFGDNCYNDYFFFSFLNGYVDFNNKTVNFESNEFSESLNYIYELLKNDSTNDNMGYDLSEEECVFLVPQSMAGGSIIGMWRSYCNLYLKGKTPIIISNFNKNKNFVSAYVQCGIAVNNNSTNKEKILAFIKYALSKDVQEYWCGASGKLYLGTNTLSLPVNNIAFNNAVNIVSDEIYNFYDGGEYDDSKKNKTNEILEVFLKDYINIIKNIDICVLYNYVGVNDTYYNSVVIGDIVEKYLNGDISKDKFIQQLTAATEIYLTE